MRRDAKKVLALAVMLTVLVSACAKKQPPVARPMPPPAAGAGGTGSVPPAPPQPISEPVPVPPEPMTDDSIAGKSLDDLNRDSPLRPLFFELDSSDVSADGQKVLQDNARASLNDIGAAVGLSSTPCWNRIKRMESAGVIRGYTVDIDPASLGFMDTVIVHVTLESHSEETLYEFGRALAQIPEVLEAFLVSGDYDYYIRIAVRDTRDYERLLREQLYRIPGIRHSKSCFVLRRLKETKLPLTGPAA